MQPPGRLTIAMGIDLTHNGRDLTTGPLYLGRGDPVPDVDVAVSARIGIAAGLEHDLRFYVRGDPHVSAGGRPPAAICENEEEGTV